MVAKKKTTTKKTLRRAAAKPETPRAYPLHTYRILAEGKAPELVHCHHVEAYDGSCEFIREALDLDRYDDHRRVTVLVLPTRAFDRIELVEDTVAIDTADQPPDPPQA